MPLKHVERHPAAAQHRVVEVADIEAITECDLGPLPQLPRRLRRIDEDAR